MLLLQKLVGRLMSKDLPIGQATPDKCKLGPGACVPYPFGGPGHHFAGQPKPWQVRDHIFGTGAHADPLRVGGQALHELVPRVWLLARLPSRCCPPPPLLSHCAACWRLSVATAWEP
eukprot:scaffold865_cov312-Prasinococcus_capsulatus_cf.AAC.13